MQVAQVFTSCNLQEFEDTLAVFKTLCQEVVSQWAGSVFGETAVLRWESTLGCACGCSPGFSVLVKDLSKVEVQCCHIEVPAPGRLVVVVDQLSEEQTQG